jgi:hypothetical protein
LKEVGNTTHASLIVSFQYRVKYCSVEKVLGMAGAVSVNAIFLQLLGRGEENSLLACLVAF